MNGTVITASPLPLSGTSSLAGKRALTNRLNRPSPIRWKQGSEGQVRISFRTRTRLRRLMSLSLLGVALTAGNAPAKGANAEIPNFSRSEEYDYEPPAPGTYKLPVVKPAADGAVLDPKGTPFRLEELTRGCVTVMSFIYTRCAAARACPYATGVLND